MGPQVAAAATGPVSFRADPDDFTVEEDALYLPSGQGEHAYLLIEKRGLSTPALIAVLAGSAGVPDRDIGIAGQKDERARTRQWVSLPGRAFDAQRERVTEALEARAATILEASRHNNKLRTGHLRGNTFTVVLRGPVDVQALQARIALAPQLPNFFGAQRFGHDDRILRDAERFANRGFRARSRREKFWVSALQSALFNRWLADRIADGTSQAALDGDVLMKTDNGAPFTCTDPVIDTARIQAREVVVAGPLMGAGMRPAERVALTAESRSWAALDVDLALLNAHPSFDVGARRPATVGAGEVQVTPRNDGVSVRFSLRKGAYASVALAVWLGSTVRDAAFAVDGPDTGPVSF